jgi:hypothetical protein
MHVLENDTVNAGPRTAQDERGLAFAFDAIEYRLTRLGRAEMDNASGLDGALAIGARRE